MKRLFAFEISTRAEQSCIKLLKKVLKNILYSLKNTFLKFCIFSCPHVNMCSVAVNRFRKLGTVSNAIACIVSHTVCKVWSSRVAKDH